MAIADLRRDYCLAGLREEDLSPDPMEQFKVWFDQALAAKLTEPNAMTLSTVGADGQPAGRIVLLKGFDQRGFIFFTNYESAKGRELAHNPKAALTIFWAELERQVRINGTCSKLGRAEGEAYFRSRPLGSRHSAHVSLQSTIIPGRKFLEDKLLEVQARFGEEVPMPEYWGGYALLPTAIEFWQGRQNRLHDRLRYERAESGGWRISRLSP